MLEIPKKFELVSQTISVEFRDDLLLTEGRFGMSRFSDNLITLQTPSPISGVTADTCLLTFYHEVAHFYMYYMGQNELNNDESFIDMLGNMMLQYEKSKKGVLFCKSEMREF